MSMVSFQLYLVHGQPKRLHWLFQTREIAFVRIEHENEQTRS